LGSVSEEEQKQERQQQQQQDSGASPQQQQQQQQQRKRRKQRSSSDQWNKQLHQFRDAWRSKCLQEWLNIERNDAEVARSTGLQAPSFLHSGRLANLKREFETASHDEVAIPTGRFTTPAVYGEWARLSCPYCGDSVCPSVDHVLWDCPAFVSLRTETRPTNDLEARIGWCSTTDFRDPQQKRRRQQMATIRMKEHPLRRQWEEQLSGDQRQQGGDGGNKRRRTLQVWSKKRHNRNNSQEDDPEQPCSRRLRRVT